MQNYKLKFKYWKTSQPLKANWTTKTAEYTKKKFIVLTKSYYIDKDGYIFILLMYIKLCRTIGITLYGLKMEYLLLFARKKIL